MTATAEFGLLNLARTFQATTFQVEVKPYGAGLSSLAAVDEAILQMKALHLDLSEKMASHSDKIAGFQSRMLSSALPGELSDYDVGLQSEMLRGMQKWLGKVIASVW
jgi:hypothetical protein